MGWRSFILMGVLVGGNVVWAQPEEAVVEESVVEEPSEPAVENPEEVAVVNDPPNAWEEFKKAVNITEPTIEAVYDFHQKEWGVGTSGSLYNFTSNDIHLGRIKAGYLATNAGYVGADVDFPGLLARYLAGKWSQGERIFSAIAKYSALGYVVGYDTEAEEVIYGPTFGATLRF